MWMAIIFAPIKQLSVKACIRIVQLKDKHCWLTWLALIQEKGNWISCIGECLFRFGDVYFALYVYVSFCIHEMELKGEGCHFKQSLRHQHLYRVDCSELWGHFWAEATKHLRHTLPIKESLNQQGNTLFMMLHCKVFHWFEEPQND